MAPVEHCLSLVRTHIPQSHLDPQKRRLRARYAVILHHTGWAYLSMGMSEEAKECFYQSIEFETTGSHEDRIEWSNSETLLCLLCGLARAYQKSGDLDDLKKATEALTSALTLVERLDERGGQLSVMLLKTGLGRSRDY